MVRRALIVLVAAALLFGAWSWYTWQSRLIVVGELRIDPATPVDPNRRYHILLWEEDLYLPGHGMQPYRDAVHEAIRELAAVYPNITVEVVFFTADELARQLEEAIAAGVGPDIVATSRGHLVDPGVQVPVDPYLTPDARDDLLPFAAAAVSLDGRLWAWPRWVGLHLWLHHADAAGVDAPEPAPSGEALLARAEALHSRGIDLVAYNAYDPALLTGIITATTGKPLLQGGLVQWEEDEIAAAAAFLQQLAAAGYVPDDPAEASRSRLAAFWERKAAAIAPVNHLLLHHAFTRVGELTQDEDGSVSPAADSQLVITAPPSLAGALLGVEGEAAAYAVLVRANYAGDDHTQAAMRVAEHLSRRLGVWLAGRLLGVPAYASAVPQWERGSGLPEAHASRLLALAEHVVAPPVDREWADLDEMLRHQVIAERLPALLARQVTAEEFAARLLQEMRALTGSRKASD